jgi:hypothetical protein
MGVIAGGTLMQVAASARPVDDYAFADDKPYATAGALAVKGHLGIGDTAVKIALGYAHGRHDNAVGQDQWANATLTEQ